MKRLTVFLAAITVVGGLAMVGVGLAQGGPPEHPHMLVLGVEFSAEGEPIGYRKCIDLAAGQALPLNAHHQHAHRGTAGEALATNAGHIVVPAAPLTEWANCDELIAAVFP